MEVKGVAEVQLEKAEVMEDVDMDKEEKLTGRKGIPKEGKRKKEEHRPREVFIVEQKVMEEDVLKDAGPEAFKNEEELAVVLEEKIISHSKNTWYGI